MYNNYECKNEDKNEITKYQPYMLTDKLISQSIVKENNQNNEKKDYKKDIENNKVIKKENNSTFFIPKEKDGLFWCFYVIKYGFASYEYPGATSFVNEKAIKFKLIESMRLKKNILKIKKIKNIKEDVEDELANKSKIGMKTFMALCISENINIIFIHKRKYFELTCNEEQEYHVIHWQENPQKYFYEMNVAKEALDNYRNTLFYWENLEKPIKSMTAYKVNELLELCKKLGLEEKIDKLNKKTKKDLYELLIQNL